MPSVRSRASRVWALFFFGLPVGTFATATSCKVGDAICTDHTVEEDRYDDCPYGPPGGPQRKKAEGCVVTFDKSNCTKTWADDVYPILVATSSGQESGGGCAQQACHGPTGSGAIAYSIGETPTPDELYATLSAVKNEAGDPYIKADDETAFFLCNLKATIGGGSAMPPTSGLTDSPNSPNDDDDLAVIEEWVRCGMANDSAAGGGGTGGGGTGGGGTGGAGGGL